MSTYKQARVTLEYTQRVEGFIGRILTFDYDAYRTDEFCREHAAKICGIDANSDKIKIVEVQA